MPFERVKEKVQLARGQRNGRLTEAAVGRGLACIDRFAQRLRGIPPDHVRVVGTSALREATNPEVFMPAAERMLGCPVRILGGDEEAELIFLGVSHALASGSEKWLVIDIGGGSTEFAHGTAFAPEQVRSVRLGCVGLTDQFFGEETVTPDDYRAARLEAVRLLQGVAPALKACANGRVLGTSGTIESVASVLGANGFSDGSITRAGLARLERAMLERRWVAQAGVPGLAPERIDIFPAGWRRSARCSKYSS
ncbi:MAG: hypothetical protein HC809_16310 [Gammaproteobacteria bacterium]|nr:hypothetical protein [Gammaproteobacteria bacterium]